ncbi:hypothetical protein [Bradyrhizobium sp. P5_C11_2]
MKLSLFDLPGSGGLFRCGSGLTADHASDTQPSVFAGLAAVEGSSVSAELAEAATLRGAAGR